MVQCDVEMITLLIAKPDKREKIVRAALELIVEHGFHGASMAMIARRAGVAVGTIFCYFQNKDILIVEIFLELEDRIHLHILEEDAPDKSIRDRLFHIERVLFRYFIDNPLHFRYMEQFTNSPYGEVIPRGCILGMKDKRDRDVYRELFEDGVSKQVMKNIPFVVFFALTFGPLFYAARDHIFGFIELNEHLIEKIINACWDSVKR